jgi:hypothetical protein
VSPAFFQTGVTESSSLAWSVTGPDGQTRTAAPDESTPVCDDTILAPTLLDERQATLEVGQPVLDADGVRFELRTEWVGIPETSVCPEGLEALPPGLTTDDGIVQESFDGTVGEWSGELQSTDAGGRALVRVALVVIDQCGADGTTQAVWSDAQQGVFQGFCVIVTEADGTLTTTTENSSCDLFDDLPGTGGGRSRPG